MLQRIPDVPQGIDAGAVWGKTETWRHNPDLLRRIEGYALVSDRRWIREWMHLVSLFVSFPLRTFAIDERDEAIAWLSSLPEGPGVTHRLLPEPGVLVVDSTLADLAPRVAEHFGRAALRHFGYDELDDAVAWAAGPSGARPAASPAEAPVPSDA